MTRDDTAVFAIAIALLALVGVGLAAASFATRQSMSGMMGGMGMGGASVNSSPGGFEGAILVASLVGLLGAIVLLLRPRAPAPASPVPNEPLPAAASATSPMPSPPASPDAISELTLVKLLDEDERRMYLEIREQDGVVLQRDLVARGMFSKAKVTRVLDKLETKGLIVRERHGMTNRIRLVRIGLAR